MSQPGRLRRWQSPVAGGRPVGRWSGVGAAGYGFVVCSWRAGHGVVTDDLHALAVEAAVAGADAIRSVACRELAPQDKGGVEDFVTVADIASERAILATIQAARPADRIVAEESGVAAGSSGVCWYVDPLDGTANIVAGKPDYAVSIAAYEHGAPVAAVIYRPADDQWLATAAGGRVQGTLLPRIGQPASLALARLTMSRPHDPSRYAEAMSLREALLPRVAEERRVGSAACALLFVATGRLDAYLSVDIPVWDTAAGHRLVELAGGQVITTRLETGTPVSIAASAPIATELAGVVSG
jgi:myo-inositol-1(or 4)-monophosphatase